MAEYYSHIELAVLIRRLKARLACDTIGGRTYGLVVELMA
jgi:hypothetical protein